MCYFANQDIKEKNVSGYYYSTPVDESCEIAVNVLEVDNEDVLEVTRDHFHNFVIRLAKGNLSSGEKLYTVW